MLELSHEARQQLLTLGYSRFVSSCQRLIEEAKQQFSLTEVEVFSGGVMGYSALCLQDNEPVVLKIQPQVITARQVRALKAARGQFVPQLFYHSDNAIVMEFISGATPESGSVSPQQIAPMIDAWQQCEYVDLPSAKEVVLGWISQLQKENLPKELGRHLSQAKPLIEEISLKANNFLHADVGYHNLLKSSSLTAIDPLGAYGDQEAEAGLAAAWIPDTGNVEGCYCFADLLGADAGTIITWAYARLSASAAFTYYRHEEEKQSQRLAALILLEKELNIPQ
jgi:hypothetical protein